MPAGLTTAQNATATLAAWHQQTQAAKEATTILGHPLVMGMIMASEAGQEMAGFNAAAGRETLVNLDALTATATPVGMLPAPSTITVANVDNTPSRFSALITDDDDEVTKWGGMRMLRLIGQAGDQVTSEVVPAIVAVSRALQATWANQLVALMKSTVSSLGNTSGAAGTAYSYTALRTAIKARRLITDKRGLGFLNGASGWDQVETDILALNGAVQFSSMAQGIVAGSESSLYSNVYSGVDILRTSGMPVAPGADVYGGVYFPGCVSLRTAKYEPSTPNRRVILDTPFWRIYELGYLGGSQTSYEMVFWMSLPVLDSALGFRILHD